MKNHLAVMVKLFVVGAVIAGIVSFVMLGMMLFKHTWAMWLFVRSITACVGFIALAFLFGDREIHHGGKR